MRRSFAIEQRACSERRSSPRSWAAAASKVISRAAQSSVTLSASMACIICFSASGSPPIIRVPAKAVASSIRRAAAPQQRAAIISRSRRNQACEKRMPSPSLPRRWSSATKTSLKR